jgi:hypothetical protein
MRTNFCLVTLMALPDCSVVCGQEPDPAKLVRDLGSPRFAVREAAEQKLVALGSKAKAAVVAGTKDADSEVARRCEAIVPKIRAAERKALIEGTIDWPAPAGTRFRNLVGDTKEARKLFALMTGDDRLAALVDAAADDPAGAAKLYAAEAARLVAALKRAHDAPGLLPRAATREHVLAFQRETHRVAVSTADVLLVLYLGSFALPDGAPDPPEVAKLLGPTFFDLATGAEQRPFAKLFAAWLGRRRDPESVQSGLEAAVIADLPEAAPTARRVAADPEASATAAGTAVLILGRHGTRQDLALLSALRADSRLFTVLDARPGGTLECEVRALATASSLALRGQDVSNWLAVRNWTVWWANPQHRPVKVPAGSSEANVRLAAVAKAWDWLDQQPGAPPKPARSGR